MKLKTYTYVILDAIILDTLVSNGTVFWGNVSALTLNIERFGTGACFHWDMGDGTSGFLYGVSQCAAHQGNSHFIEIKPNIEFIYHEYVYKTFDIFTVTVFAFNNVSDDSLSEKAIVIDWLCFPPNITYDEKYKDTQEPFENWKSVGFEIEVNYSVDCMKTKVVDTTWKIFRKGEENRSPVIERKYGFSFIYEPRQLEYGDYTVELNASMANVTNTTNLGYFYLRIVKSPLVAFIEPGPYAALKYNNTFEIDAVTGSYDPDVEPEVSKGGLRFTGFCRKNGTEDIFEEVYKNKTFVEWFKTQTGCFGGMAGSIDVGNGRFLINTVNMYPMTFYTLEITVLKDTRETTFEQLIYVPSADPPVLEIG